MKHKVAHKKIIIDLEPHLKKSGMSMRELARATGTSHHVFSKWMRQPIESINLRILANVVTILELDDINKLLIIVDEDDPDA